MKQIHQLFGEILDEMNIRDERMQHDLDDFIQYFELELEKLHERLKYWKNVQSKMRAFHEPKQVVDSEMEAPTEQGTYQPIKRKRGRPRKVQYIEDQIEPIRHKRGKPRKISLEQQQIGVA